MVRAPPKLAGSRVITEFMMSMSLLSSRLPTVSYEYGFFAPGARLRLVDVMAMMWAMVALALMLPRWVAVSHFDTRSVSRMELRAETMPTSVAPHVLVTDQAANGV